MPQGVGLSKEMKENSGEPETTPNGRIAFISIRLDGHKNVDHFKTKFALFTFFESDKLQRLFCRTMKDRIEISLYKRKQGGKAMIEINEYKDELQRCVLKISGTGEINDYEDIRQRPWDNHRYEFRRIIIEDGITRIGKNAFIDCPNVTSITLPNSVTSIGENAFRGCSIDELVIPDGVTTIEKYAFGSCEQLSEITISDNVTFIGEYAFAGFNNLSKIKLPKKLTSIEPGTFYFCVNLKEVIIPDGVTVIKARAFKDCEQLQEIVIPNSVKTIEVGAFDSCKKLKKAVIPNSVSCVGESVFVGCSKLSVIEIANPNLKFGKNIFGEKAKDFPKALVSKANDLIQHLDIALVNGK